MSLYDTRIRPATTAQVRTIKRLSSERVLDQEHAGWITNALKDAVVRRLAAESATTLITSLRTLPCREA